MAGGCSCPALHSSAGFVSRLLTSGGLLLSRNDFLWTRDQQQDFSSSMGYNEDVGVSRIMISYTLMALEGHHLQIVGVTVSLTLLPR